MATWDPSDEDIRRVLEEQNPWAATGDVPGALAPPGERALTAALWKRVLRNDPPRYQLVLGPRRVGKTTVMYQTVKRLLEAQIPKGRLWWFRLDHPFLMHLSLDKLVTSALEVMEATVEDPLFLFLDELVYASDWDLWLKTFYDQRYPVRIVATSSATAALRDRRMESGVGRWEEQFLMPYLFSEFLDLVGREAPAPIGESLAHSVEMSIAQKVRLEDIEKWRQLFALIGGFPELLMRIRPEGDPDPEPYLLESQRVLRSDAVERAIYKDIPQSFGVDNPLILERLLYTLAGQVAGVLSPKNLGSQLGITQPTFDRYLSYFERAFIIFTLSNYSGREARIQRRGRKLYFTDGAIRNAALQRGLAPLRNPTELGLLLENLVASHLYALAQHTQVRLYHWRDGRHEVDFVYDHPDRPLAIEVASSPDHSRSGLVALADRFPRFRERCYLVAPSAHPLPPSKGREGVGTFPFDLFLVLLGRQAERALSERLS